MTTLSANQLDLIAASLQPSLNAHLKSLLQNRFLELKSGLKTCIYAALKTEWDKMRAKVNTNLNSIRDLVPNKVKKLSSAPITAAKPPVLADCLYSGGQLPLRGFIHVMRDVLSFKTASFTNNSAHINWVARHFKPIGGWDRCRITPFCKVSGIIISSPAYLLSPLPFHLLPLSSQPLWSNLGISSLTKQRSKTSRSSRWGIYGSVILIHSSYHCRA